MQRLRSIFERSTRRYTEDVAVIVEFRWHTETVATPNPELKLRRMDITVTEAPSLTPVRARATSTLVDKPYAWATMSAFFGDPT